MPYRTPLPTPLRRFWTGHLGWPGLSVLAKPRNPVDIFRYQKPLIAWQFAGP
jgi:hypothetical protein